MRAFSDAARFATGPALYGSDALIQEFYVKEAANPVHLLVDTTLADKNFNIQAYVSRALCLGEKNLAMQFVEVPCEVSMLFGLAASGSTWQRRGPVLTVVVSARRQL